MDRYRPSAVETHMKPLFWPLALSLLVLIVLTMIGYVLGFFWAVVGMLALIGFACGWGFLNMLHPRNEE